MTIIAILFMFGTPYMYPLTTRFTATDSVYEAKLTVRKCEERVDKICYGRVLVVNPDGTFYTIRQTKELIWVSTEEKK